MRLLLGFSIDVRKSQSVLVGVSKTPLIFKAPGRRRCGLLGNTMPVAAKAEA
jgi:hypothetical protein